MCHDPLELACRFIPQAEPGGADRQVIVKEKAARILLEGCPQVGRCGGPVGDGERLPGLREVVYGSRRLGHPRYFRSALATPDRERETERH